MSESQTTINDLPDEVLEYTLSLLSPYRDYKNMMLVCHRWYNIIKGVQIQEFQHFREAISEGGLCWTAHPVSPSPTITERYSHSACYLNKCLYVFGGCTSNNTTFNDLWKLDLGSGKWIRPLAMGSYPSPKAYASLVSHRERLILFGGWSHPTPLSLHQSARFFPQLHVYSPQSNNWEEIVTLSSPQGLAGHGATVIADTMIVFGGCTNNGISCNDIWVLNLNVFDWTLKNPAGKKPLARYGHAQIKIDDSHILVVGGCGGPNMQFTDTWLLSMGADPWRWDEVQILHPENSAPQIWCHPACKVGDKMVVLSKVPKVQSSGTSSIPAPQFREPPLSVTGADYHSTLNHRLEEAAPPSGHCFCCQEFSLNDKLSQRIKRSYPETSESSSQDSSSDNDDTINFTSGRSISRQRVLSGGGLSRKGPPCLRPPTASRVLQSQPAKSESLLFREQLPSTSNSQDCDESSESIKVSVGDDLLSPTKATSPSKDASLSNMRGGQPSIRPNAMRNRQKQLEMLKRYEDRIKGQKMKEASASHTITCCHGSGGQCRLLFLQQKKVLHPMYVHCLDMSQVTETKTATWLPLTEYGSENAPDETLFYSLVEGRGELIMFGGIQTDVNSMRRPIQSSHVVSNVVYFINPKKILR